MAFRLDYPTFASSTSSWVPSHGPQYPGKLPETLGVLVDVMATGLSYRYGMAPQKVRIFEYSFEYLTDTDRSNYMTFKSAVGVNAFQLTDPMTSTVYDVAFDADTLNNDPWDNAYPPPGPWTVTLKFREEI